MFVMSEETTHFSLEEVHFVNIAATLKIASSTLNDSNENGHPFHIHIKTSPSPPFPVLLPSSSHSPPPPPPPPHHLLLFAVLFFAGKMCKWDNG